MTAQPEPLYHTFMKARLLRDWPTVHAIADRFLKHQPNHLLVHRALARLYVEQGERQNALPHWQALRAADPKDFEAVYHLARAMTGEGVSADRAVASVACDLPPAFADNLRAVLSNPPAAPGQQGVRVVVIGGVSHCGSTLFDRLLGSLPGAASIGESHWLVKGRAANGYDLLDFSREFAADMVTCTVCGRACRVLTADFRRGLSADQTDWYFRIANQLKTEILVAADKNPAKFLDNDPLLRLDALVLFKSLPQAWWSELQERKPGQDEAYYLAECEKYVQKWVQSYSLFLEHFSPEGKVAFVSFEEFARDPAPVLRAACDAMSLPFDESVLKTARQGHAIGGNSAALRRLRSTGYEPDIFPLVPPQLPQSHARVIAESIEAKRIFELLQSAHDTTMRGAA